MARSALSSSLVSTPSANDVMPPWRANPTRPRRTASLFGSPVGLVDKAAVDLDELRMELQDVRHARIAGSHVVDGEHGRGGRPHLEAAAQFLVVLGDRLVLGDLDHPGRELAGDTASTRESRNVLAERLTKMRTSPGGTPRSPTACRQASSSSVRTPRYEACSSHWSGPAAAGNDRPGQHLVAEDRTVGQAPRSVGRPFRSAPGRRSSPTSLVSDSPPTPTGVSA